MSTVFPSVRVIVVASNSPYRRSSNSPSRTTSYCGFATRQSLASVAPETLSRSQMTTTAIQVVHRFTLAPTHWMPARGAMSSDVSTGQEDTREQEGVMRRLILQTGLSIDGYVAALDRSHPWGDGG